jgi:hypothetical protein
VVKFHDRVVRPKLPSDLLPRHHLARVIDDHSKDTKGLFLEEDFSLVLMQFSRSEVAPEGPETNYMTCSRVLHRN